MLLLPVRHAVWLGFLVTGCVVMASKPVGSANNATMPELELFAKRALPQGQCSSTEECWDKSCCSVGYDSQYNLGQNSANNSQTVAGYDFLKFGSGGLDADILNQYSAEEIPTTVAMV